MNSNTKRSWSLKTRLTLFTLVIFLISIWSLAYYASQRLYVDMRNLMGEQQLTTASTVASVLNRELDDRIKGLEKVADLMGPHMLDNTASMQEFLERRPVLQNQFNAGLYITNLDGTAIASIPVSAGRVGVNYMERDHIVSALKEGKARVSKPVIGKNLKIPVISIGVPIHDAQGKVIGALSGVVDLSSKSFLDIITGNHYGKTGGYLLVAPQYRLVVTATDKRRIMQPLPAPGINPYIDRNIAGFEGYTILVNPLGVKELASIKKIPAAGWYLAVTLPAKEAFAPIHKMQQRILSAALVLTLIAGGLTWWMLRRLLSPLFATIATLGAMNDSNLPLQPLPVIRQDEIGQLINAFNRMLGFLAQREEVIRESEHEFRMLAESMPQIVWICSPDGMNIYFNQQWVDYTGLPLEESYGHGWIKPFHPDDQQRAWDAWRNAVTNSDSYTVKCRLRQADGIYKWWLIRGVPVKDAHGTILKWFGTCTDIDEIKRAEEEKLALEQQFQQTQRLESLGVLAGGIAHDFNNILGAIIGYCSMAQLHPEKVKNYLPEIDKAAQRAAGLCRQMLAYAGKGQFVLSQVNMAVLADEMVNMLKSTTGPNVTINTALAADTPSIRADANQLRQIVMNLVINASEAIGESQGEVRVALAKTTIQVGQTVKDHLGTVIPAGQYICLEVSDNGCGMDDETKGRIFEPFYTTKFMGRGLGMSAALGIIKAHGGALQLTSQPALGTTFKVYLPVQDTESVEDESTNQAPSVPWQGSGTILLVEDEEMIMEVAETLLENLGFTVIKATNGKEALELYQKHATDICLVMTDVGMPVMGGYELFRELKKLKADLPIIISSGFGDTVVTSQIAHEDIAGLVSKPYSFDQLSAVLMGAVDGVPPRQA